MADTPLVDKHGTTIHVGDKLRLPDGDVVQVQGSLGIRRRIRANRCELVSKTTKLTHRTLPVVDHILWG